MALKGVRVAGLYSLEELENGNQALESAAALGATIENDYDKVDVFIAETVLSEAYMVRANQRYNQFVNLSLNQPAVLAAGDDTQWSQEARGDQSVAGSMCTGATAGDMSAGTDQETFLQWP
jgi:hypothetical protein